MEKTTVENREKEDSFFRNNMEDLRKDSVVNELIQEASQVMENSYSPYSKFKVGAAILTDKGNIYRGTNVENVSFGGTICAERGAAMAAIAAEGKTLFKAIAVTSQSEEPAPPCAICRQFLSEFANSDMDVYLYSVKSQKIKHFTLGYLLPEGFAELGGSKK